LPGQRRLLRTHVLERADDHAHVGLIDASLSCCPSAFRQTKVDYLDDRLALLLRDQQIRRLDIAVDDALLMRMLNRATDRMNSAMRCSTVRRLASQ
jgi:hypothetical protein